MALTQEEKTQKQVDAAVKAAVKRERATFKAKLAEVVADVKNSTDKTFIKSATAVLKDVAERVKTAQAASDAPSA